MSRRTLVISCGLLLISVLGNTVFGQAPPRRPTISERLSAFGRGITGSEETQAQQPTVPAQSTDAPATRANFPQVDGRSLLPNNMFGRTPQTQQSPHPSTERAGAAAHPTTPQAGASVPTTNRTATAQSRQANTSNTTGSTADRYAARPAAPGATNSNNSGASLPGLGGSPLPISAGDDDASGAGSASESAIEKPIVEPFIPTESFRGTSGNSSTTSGSSSTTSTRPSPSAGTAPRQSPQRRTPLHVDATELRHELAGSFPTSESGDAGAQPAVEPQSKSTASGSEPQTQPQENVFTLPTANANAADNSNSAATPDVTPLRSTPTTREEGTPFIPQATENATRYQPSTGFAPTTTPIPITQPIQTIPTQPVTQTPAATPRRQTASASPKPSAPAIQGSLTEPNILSTNRAPVITSDIRGPKQIMVGREATFRVRLENKGDGAAEGVDVVVRVPSWADVVESSPSSGAATQSPTDPKGLLRWQIARLEPHASEMIELKLIPRNSRPLELGVTWTLAPIGSKAVVEVQEPKIEMNVAGPDEVMFGKPQVYRFTIANPGTGVAEGIKIDLYPPGGGDKPAASNPLANLHPGKSQTIEVELVARDAGKLKIRAVATAAGDITSEAVKEVFCRKPELALDWRGPEMKYAGTDATYFIRVRNPGTAPAEDVTVRAVLPEGAQLTTASEGQVFDASRREVAWRVGSLGPGDDSYMELKCTVTTPGVNQLKIEAATAAGDLSDKKLVETKVVALGDLKLDVTDPSGPVAVGDTAVYEIRVQNRGASSAKDINIVGLFSAGVEPEQSDGSQYTVSNGRVSFRAIDDLPAGRQVTFKIKARAAQPGTHVFRAEVLCRELDIKLAAEETTRFYADDPRDAERQAAGSNNNFEAIR